MNDLLEVVLGFLGPWGENRYLQALLIVLVSAAIAKLTDWLLIRGLTRWTRRTRTDADDRLVQLLHRPIFSSVFLAGLALATLRLQLPAPFAWFCFAVLKTLAVLVWLVFSLRATALTLEVLDRRRVGIVDSRTRPLFENLLKVALAGGAVYFVLLTWNLDVSAWLASAGIVGIALGFAARDSLANLFAGVFILADAPYKVDDFIILDSGERGRVLRVGIRSTRLLTRDDVEVTIPNAVMGNAKIVNESGGPWEKQRIRIKVSVAYGSDVDQVRSVLVAVAGENDQVCKEPEPRVRFRAFGDSGLNFELLCWIDEPVAAAGKRVAGVGAGAVSGVCPPC
jgi:small-conductance mechanosensitive channel